MAEETSHKSRKGTSEEYKIRNLVKQVAERQGFTQFELTFGEDFTGKSAVWISFLLDREYPTTVDSINTLANLGQLVKSHLFEHDIGRIPYIRFRERQKAAG